MISESRYQEAYVWVWLPGAVQPVVAGRLAKDGNTLLFNYGRSYLERTDSVPLYSPELPLRSGLLPLLQGMNMPGCLRDAAPDAWGRRVLMFKRAGGKRNEDLDELSCLLESGSNRIGALDFQFSPTTYQSRMSEPVTLEALQESTAHIVNGQSLTPELAAAIQHGTSIGGARPKANIETDDKQYVAKFSLSTDLYNIVKAEFIAMRLAHLVGLDVAPVELKTALNKDVLLVERFDRIASEAGWQRKMMISALTLLELDEMFARYASYEDLAEIIRHRFPQPAETLRELFGRMVFNILCGNTDDHARNHAAFWDGRRLTLTPAYDLCPQSRAGNEASQAMKIHGDNNLSRLKVCLAAAHSFMLSTKQAQEIIDHQLDQIEANWDAVCDQAELPKMARQALWGRQFLNPFAFE